MCKSVWILTTEHNLYDQQGEYFLECYPAKPTSGQLRQYMPYEDIQHVLSGGGRRNYEEQWFHLREHKFPQTI